MQSDDIDDDNIATILHDLRQLRLRLAADLTVAGNAVAAGDTDIAADIVDANSIELQHFLTSAGARLSDAPIPGVVQLAPARGRKLRRRVLAVVPAVAVLAASATAAALVSAHAPQSPAPTIAAVTTVHPVAGHTRPDEAVDAASVSTGLHQLRAAIVSDRSPKQVLAAAERLHQQLSILIAHVNGNPAKVAQIERWLQAEQSLVKTTVPVVAEQILASSRQLAQHLRATATSLPLAVPTLPTLIASPPAQPSAKPTPSPAASTTAAPKPSNSGAGTPSTSSSSHQRGFDNTAQPSWSPTNPVDGLGQWKH